MDDIYFENSDPEEYRKICSRLIAVTNRTLCSRPFPEQIERVCLLHPKAIILREKDLPKEEYRRLAKDVLEICKKYNVTCIFHSFPEIAVELGCPYIHFPLFLLEKCQNLLPYFKEIGSSVHSPEEAVKAERLGATYLTAGHVFTTDCKKGLPARGLEFLKNTVDSVSIPVYGIGGIKINAGQLNMLLDCGAAGGCVMSGMMEI